MVTPKIPKQRSWLYIFIYLFIYEGILSGAVSGGVNFAIAYGMYAKRDRQVTLWRFPHTMSGDCAVTSFVQVVITHIIEEIIVGWECYTGNTFYFPSISYFASLNIWVFRALEVDRGMIPFGMRDTVDRGVIPPALGDEVKDNSKPTFGGYLKELIVYDNKKNCFINFIICAIHKVILAILVAIPIWFIEWPVAMGILAGIGNYIGGIEYELGNYPKPQLIKLVYTIILGFISTPISIALVILRNQCYVEYYRAKPQLIDGEATKIYDTEKKPNMDEKTAEEIDPSFSSDSEA